MAYEKNLIINPTLEQKTSGLIMIKPATVITDLVNKVFSTTHDKFKPLLFEDKHARLFLANVESKVVAVSRYSGKEINTLQEGSDYLNELGTKIYGTSQWKVKLIKNEVLLTKGVNYGIYLSDEEFIKALKDETATLITITVNPSTTVPTKNKNKTQTKPQTETKNESEN
jgi:hypothetical protein